jgi:molecular chaperone HtpG
MYADPLMVYREYIQNAVDAVDAAVAGGRILPDAGQVGIQVCGRDRSVMIEDNGCGIGPEDASHFLVDIGNSAKDGHLQRGFRGIGRLGGIGYCDLLRFETRAAPNESVAVVEWGAAALRDLLARGARPLTLESAVQRACTATCRRSKKGEPGRFFRVTLLGVRPFHDDVLMDLGLVRQYLSQAAPVPYDATRFSLTEKVTGHLEAVNGFRTYEIVVNAQPVFRPYTDELSISAGKTVAIQGAELFEFRTEDGACLARGWYAKTPFYGALPRGMGIRGMRVRQGNMQIGDEHLLADCFAEPRFASWHIGEVHVANGHLRPNARRDGYEQSRHYERFLQQAYALGRHLSHECRRAAADESAARRASRMLVDLEDLLARCALQGADDGDDAICARAKKILSDLESYADKHGVPDGTLARLRSARRELAQPTKLRAIEDCLDGRALRNRTGRELLKEVSARIHEFHSVSSSAEELVARVLEPYVRPTALRRLRRLGHRSEHHR